MSINHITLKDKHESLLKQGELPFHLYESESIRYFTPSPRQSLNIESQKNTSDPEPHQISISAADGYLYVTNKRLIYITVSKGDINNFLFEFTQTPSLQFSHKLVSPWFGANYWEFLFHSTKLASDGFPYNNWFKGTIKFNDGGLFDFIPILNVVLNDQVNNAQIDEELPRYEA